MKCANPECPEPKKEHFALFAGGLCALCKDVKIVTAKKQPKPQPEKKKMGRPVGEVPHDHKKYNSKYYAENKEKIREYNRNYKRMKKNTVIGRFIIRCGFQYVQPNNHPKLGARSTAKVYSSLAYARQGAKRLEGAVIEKKEMFERKGKALQ